MLSSWKTQFTGGEAVYFSCLKNVCATLHFTDMKRFKDKLTGLLREFEQHFQIFGQLEKDFKVFCSPSAANVWSAYQHSTWNNRLAVCLKFEGGICHSWLRHILSVSLPGYPNLTALAAKVLWVFGTTYLCEQVFSVMNITKTKLHSRLLQQHLNDILKLAATQDVTPDIDALVKAKRCQFSGAKSSVGNPISNAAQDTAPWYSSVKIIVFCGDLKNVNSVWFTVIMAVTSVHKFGLLKLFMHCTAFIYQWIV